MFSNLFNFGYERSGIQAVGFYIAYLILFMLVGVIATLANIYLFPHADIQASNLAAVKIGKAISLIGSTYLCMVIARKKGFMIHYKTFFLMLLSGVLATFIGAIGGLIPAAYLSTSKMKTPEIIP